MEVQTYHPIIWVAEAEDREFKTSLGYIGSQSTQLLKLTVTAGEEMKH